MDEIKIGDILEPGNDETRHDRERDVRANFWNKMRSAAGCLPFMEDVIAGYYCALDPQTPPRVRGILLAALAYFILPLDTLPDFIAGFGFTDDIAVLTAAFAAVRGSITQAHRAAAKQALAEGHENPDRDVA